MAKTPAEAHKELKLMLCAPTTPIKTRRDMLAALATSNGRAEQALLEEVLEAAARAEAKNVYVEKSKELVGIIQAIESEGAHRSAVFLKMEQPINGFAPRAAVLLEDGNLAFVTVPYPQLAEELQPGQNLIIEAQGRLLIRVANSHPVVGEVAVFERPVSESCIEVSLRSGQDRLTVLTTPEMRAAMKAGKLAPGANVIVNPRQRWAFGVASDNNKYAHYQFLDKGPIPDVVLERDVACPPRFIQDATTHVWTELTKPELHRRFGIPHCFSRLLVGPSGGGKSFLIEAAIRKVLEVTAEFLGCRLDQLPKLVMRWSPGKLLSKFHGESEKLVERATDEVFQRADAQFEINGRTVSGLPVFLILEEVDGIGRSRSAASTEFDHGAMDRVLACLLSRLDPCRPALRDRLIIMLSTTNTPSLLDGALVRRIGQNIETVGRLNRQSFAAVLRRHVERLPVVSFNGEAPPEKTWSQHIADLTAWLFAPNGTDPGLVEVSIAGSTTPLVKQRRDFLTPAIVARAVQSASAEAVKHELAGTDGLGGLTLELLMQAFERQFRGLAETLRENSVGQYCELPDGARVVSLRRIPQSARLPIEFIRPESGTIVPAQPI